MTRYIVVLSETRVAIALAAPHITHQQANMRKTVTAGELLVIIARFLATGGVFVAFSTEVWLSSGVRSGEASN